ncbi:MAG: YceI family protein [Bryobacteraceae bacterium]
MKPFFFLLAGAMFAQEMRIAPGGGNKVEGIVEKTGLMSGKKHLLAWEKFDGKLSVSPARVEFFVEAGSVRVLDDWIGDGKKEDVRKETVGKNVLDVDKFMQIRFISTGVSGDTGASFQVMGDLTVRGITKPVTLAVKRNGISYEGETKFAMSGFGIKPPKAALGAIGTKDEMTIRFVVGGSR